MISSSGVSGHSSPSPGFGLTGGSGCSGSGSGVGTGVGVGSGSTGVSPGLITSTSSPLSIPGKVGSVTPLSTGLLFTNKIFSSEPY